MRKRGIITVLTSMLVFIALQSFVFAAQSGSCGENITWTLENGTLTISGTGDMKDYMGFGDFPEYRELEIKNIIVKEGVTSVGRCAFHGSSATSISLPNTITKINDNAFVFSHIKQIEIPDSVTYIGLNNVSDALVSLKIGDSVENLDKIIGFQGNNTLSEIFVDEDNQHYASQDNVLFNKDKTELILFCGGAECEEYTVPDTVKKIGDGAFNYCKRLKKITIPEGVTEIGSAFFATWDMKSIMIPKSVEKMSAECFDIGSNGEEVEYVYSGTMEDFDKIQLYSQKYVGEDEINGRSIYEEVLGELPEFCVNIKYANGVDNEKASNNDVENKNNDIKVILNGKIIEFDVQPQIMNDRTMVPMRAIFENLGATVDYIQHTFFGGLRQGEIRATDGSVSVCLWEGEIIMTVCNNITGEEKEIQLDAPPIIVDSRTLVPVRAISETFGCNVDWDEKNRQVIITK